MGQYPQFAQTPRVGVATVTATNTNRDGTGTIVDALTAGAAGTRIEEVVVKATGDPADCTVTVYLHDGSTYHIFDEYDRGNPATGSATVASDRLSTLYDNLIIPAGWKIAFAVTAAPTAGAYKCIVLGGDL